MIRHSYAKVNLALNVEKKLKDNYHALDMVNVSISLHDTIIAAFNKKGNISIESNDKNVPTDENNTIYKVIKKFQNTYKISFGVKVKLIKRIPAQSGLGGGSSNAATMLKMLDKKFKTNLSFIEMNRFISDITSDGAFSLYTFPARVRGKGELVTPINDFKLDSKLFLLKPISGCNTKDIYTKHNDENNNKVNINKVLQGIKDNNIDLLSKNCKNSLKESIEQNNKDVTKCLDLLYQCGFDVIGISGSGSSCFGIAKSNKIYKNAKKSFLKGKL